MWEFFKRLNSYSIWVLSGTFLKLPNDLTNVVTIKTGFISYLQMEHCINQRLSDIRGFVSVIVATWKLKRVRAVSIDISTTVLSTCYPDCTILEKLCSFFKKLVHFLAEESNCCLEVCEHGLWSRGHDN